jgi:hypothetical protein
MNAGLLFRPNHPSRVVRVIMGRALVIIANTVAPTGAKVNSQFFLVRVDGRK